MNPNYPLTNAEIWIRFASGAAAHTPYATTAASKADQLLALFQDRFMWDDYNQIWREKPEALK